MRSVAATPAQQRAPWTVMDRTLSSAANLVKLLPSGTVLVFQALSSPFSNRGACHLSNKYLTSALILVCALACALLSFTDSLRGRDGRLYYGMATLRGLYVLNYYDDDDGGAREGERDRRREVFGDEDGELRRYRLRALDGVHAVLAVVTFLTVAFSETDVVSCFFPEAGGNMRQLLINLPMGAGVLASVVFMIFPTTRKGIGYSDIMHHHPDH